MGLQVQCPAFDVECEPVNSEGFVRLSMLCDLDPDSQLRAIRTEWIAYKRRVHLTTTADWGRLSHISRREIFTDKAIFIRGGDASGAGSLDLHGLVHYDICVSARGMFFLPFFRS